MKNRFIAGALIDGQGRNTEITERQLLQVAPSIFAAGKHESRSERYAYIPTIEVVRGLIGEGFHPVFAKQGTSRVPGKADFTKHLIRFRHDTNEMRRVGDSVPEVILINSHDGTSAYWLMAGVFRGLCRNGLIAAESIVPDVKVGHSGNVTNKVIEGTWSLVKGVGNVMDETQAMREVDLSYDEMHVFAEAAHELRFEDGSEARQFLNPRKLLTPRRDEDRKGDLWTVFNRVQENVIKGGLDFSAVREREVEGRVERNVRSIQTRPVHAIDGDTKINRALWVLAEGMRRLKSGEPLAA